jgi:hypothetical protein
MLGKPANKKAYAEGEVRRASSRLARDRVYLNLSKGFPRKV